MQQKNAQLAADRYSEGRANVEVILASADGTHFSGDVLENSAVCPWDEKQGIKTHPSSP